MNRANAQRQTRIGIGDRRVRGPYEQTADWPSVRSYHEAVADTLGSVAVLRVRGLVGQPLTLDYGHVVAMARLESGGTLAVPMTDLLARCELAVESDLLVLSGYTSRSTLLPVRDAVRTPPSSLVLRDAGEPLLSIDEFLLRLDAPTHDQTSGSHGVTSIEATTFRAFVQ